MTEYKDRFYRAYYSSHIVPRKGEFTLERFEAYARVFDRVWSGTLPADKSARILDAGCGSGSLVWWMQQRGYQQAGGIDVSAEQVATAHALGVRNVAEGDLIPYLAGKPGWYDRVILRDVIEHFTRDAIVDTLDTCRRALRPLVHSSFRCRTPVRRCGVASGTATSPTKWPLPKDRYGNCWP